MEVSSAFGMGSGGEVEVERGTCVWVEELEICAAWQEKESDGAAVIEIFFFLGRDPCAAS